MLGEPFFKSYLVAFNLEKMQIGIVKLRLKVFDNIRFYNGTFAYLAICKYFYY